VKFRRENTLTVLSEVAVARRGRPFGLGTEAQARDDAGGLNSARAAICTVCGALDGGEAIISAWWCNTGRWRGRENHLDYRVAIRLAEVG
jgi:hypothetical protein